MRCFLKILRHPPICGVLFSTLVLAGSNTLAISVGDTVEVYNTGASGLKAWTSTCSGSYVIKYDGIRGVVISGPVSCSGYSRWKIDWDGDSTDRWSAGDWLREVEVLLPAPTLRDPNHGETGVSITPSLDWDSVSGANRYWVMVAKNAADLPTDPDATSCPDCVSDGASGLTGSSKYDFPDSFPYGGTTRTLEPGTRYYWQVQAYSTDGTQGEYSTIRSFTTAAAVTLLPAPALTGPSNGATGVSTTPTLDWNSVSGANRYWLMVAKDPSDLPTDPNETSCAECITDAASGITTSTEHNLADAFPVSGSTQELDPATTYYWQVQAYNTDGTQGEYSTIRSFTTAAAVTLLPAPSLTGPSDGATGVSITPTFSWSSVSGANRYWLMVATDSADLPTDPDATSCPECVSVGISGNTGATSYTAPNAFPYNGTTRTLSPGGTYYWRVQAYNTDGTQGHYSLIRSFTTENSGSTGEPASLGVLWNPSQNYNDRPLSQTIDSVIIHTVQGSYSSGISTLQDTSVPLEERVSAHYIISPNGEITQLVRLSKRAWHGTYYNDRSIGIEMAGYSTAPSTWNAENLNALENLVAYLANTFAIPILHPDGDASTYPSCLFTETGIIGHSQIQPGCNSYSTKPDPGEFFPWVLFIQNVIAKAAGGTDSTNPTIEAFSVPSNYQTLGITYHIGYTVSDSGGSGLDRVELWRTTDDNGAPNAGGWTQITTHSVSGNGPVSGSFAESPGSPGNYWYGMHVVDNDGNLSDESEFGLGPERLLLKPRIAVASPNGGESWVAGSSHNITWTTEGQAGNVRIVLAVLDSPQIPDIVSNTPNDGSFEWTVPVGIAHRSDYNIHIEELTYGAWDVSDNVFSIVAPTDTTDPTVTITSPTAAATFSAATASLNLSGTASDDVGVTAVAWSNDRGGSGLASGTTTWTVSGIGLSTGINTIRVAAVDAAANTGDDTLTVTYDPLTCAAVLGEPTPGVMSDAPPTFHFTLTGPCTGKVYIATSSTPALINVYSNKFEGGPHSFTPSYRRWRNVADGLGHAANYYWTIGDADLSHYVIYADWQAFTIAPLVSALYMSNDLMYIEVTAPNQSQIVVKSTSDLTDTSEWDSVYSYGVTGGTRVIEIPSASMTDRHQFYMLTE